MKLNLTKKLAALFLLFGLVPMLILGMIAYQATGTITDNEGRRFQSSAKMIADQIDRNLAERYGDVQAFALNQFIGQRVGWFDPEGKLSSIMNQYVKAYGIYALMILVDLEGRVISVNSKDDGGKPIDTKSLYKQNFKNVEWFQRLKSGKFTTRMPFTAPRNDKSTGTFITDVNVDKNVAKLYPGSDGLVIGFSAPVRYTNEFGTTETIAYWHNVTKFSLVEEIFQSTYQRLKHDGYPSAELTLLDKSGRIIVDYDPTVSGSEKVVHDFENVLFKLNLAKKGVKAAQLP